MSKKLTLRLDEKLIKRAKKYAREKGTSVSQLVANYFQAIDNPTQDTSSTSEDKLPPITRSLAGALKNTDTDEADYREYLEQKHL